MSWLSVAPAIIRDSGHAGRALTLTSRSAESYSMPLTIAIGVMAHNEEANIARLLDSILAQTALDRIARVMVVASGCTDKTCEIVEAYCSRDARITLVAEAERGGKVNAIN